MLWKKFKVDNRDTITLFDIVRMSLLTHILAQYTISIPPEKVRKPSSSDVFRGYRNKTLG